MGSERGIGLGFRNRKCGIRMAERRIQMFNPELFYNTARQTHHSKLRNHTVFDPAAEGELFTFVFAEKGRGRIGWGPFHDQGIFVSIIVRNRPSNLKSQRIIKGLGPLIASPHLRLHLFRPGSLHRPEEEFRGNASPSMMRVDRNRKDMPVQREDDIG